MTSTGPRPFRVSIASITSTALPTARPSGVSIAVSIASVASPLASAIRIRLSASVRACASVFMNAPRPTLTSSTSPFAPSAIFLLRIDAAISGTLSIVPVTSRSAYNRRSAGATSSVCPTKAHPVRRRTPRISDRDNRVRNPGIDSSLSSVPPVWPRPRPDIIGTTTPHAAASGAEHQRDLVSHAARRVLVDHRGSELCQVEAGARRHHRVGERGRFAGRHAAKHDRHQQRGDLIVRPAAIGDAGHEPANIPGIKRSAVTFLTNQIDRAHAGPSIV